MTAISQTFFRSKWGLSDWYQRRDQAARISWAPARGNANVSRMSMTDMHDPRSRSRGIPEARRLVQSWMRSHSGCEAAQFDIVAPFSVCDGSRCTDLMLASWSISRCGWLPIISGSGTLITSTPSGFCCLRVSKLVSCHLSLIACDCRVVSSTGIRQTVNDAILHLPLIIHT